MPNKPEVKTS